MTNKVTICVVRARGSKTNKSGTQKMINISESSDLKAGDLVKLIKVKAVYKKC